ncbi:hypothetical protein [Aeromicrobium sp. Leaf291]|uniref:hypothetical protein n=1 Tax=Aeromicrobium sp. Leaf291 TaxID=1736325 RepID=UPI0006FC61F9|nr:hypothetical protein [Aeromicrobium sp. Leaf291]KQP81582.1 hypothetical protein ASF35_16255 [Aeromicrobium sp. Leaf291]
MKDTRAPALKRHPRTGSLLQPVGYVNGRAVWPILGASPDDPSDDGGDGGAGGDGGDGGDGGGGDGGRTFTQDEVSQKLTEEKRQGRRAGARDVLSRVGFETAEELEAFVTSQREAAEAAKTEDQRRADALEERERKLAAREVETEKKERVRVRRAALRDVDVKADDLDDALLLLSREVEEDADEDAVAEAVEKLKGRRPELFGKPADDEEGEPKPRRRGHYQPSGGPQGRNDPPGKDPGAYGRERAARRWKKD